MKRFLVAFLVLAIAAAAFAHHDSKSEVIKRGAKIEADAKAVSMETVLQTPDAYSDKAVVVEGVILNACDRKGCWMQLAPKADAQGVRVTFKDYGFFVPLDSKGMHARAEGVTVVKTLSKAEADHLESEGAKLNRNADGTAKEVSFVANGVELWK